MPRIACRGKAATARDHHAYGLWVNREQLTVIYSLDTFDYWGQSALHGQCRVRRPLISMRSYFICRALGCDHFTRRRIYTALGSDPSSDLSWCCQHAADPEMVISKRNFVQIERLCKSGQGVRRDRSPRDQHQCQTSYPHKGCVRPWKSISSSHGAEMAPN
jgi:hypothetical protein